MLDDLVSEQLACRMLGCRSLQGRKIPVEELDDQRMVRIADLIGKIRRSRFRLKDAQEWEGDAEYIPEREQSRWIPISRSTDYLDAEVDTLLRWVQTGKIRSRTQNGEIHLDKHELEIIGGGLHRRAEPAQ